MSQTTTITTPSSTLLALNALKTPPLKLSNSFDDYPKLTREECGHLRHFHNLVSLPDGEWSHMGAQEPGQEWDTAFRYQIATMGYAVGAAHYHRLPAMRAVFKKLLLKVINKMLRREVWGYWFDSSHSGPRLDPDLKELRKPWADPVCKENIMYSGHLLLLVSLYTMLFAKDTFDKDDSLVFNWDPMFWGIPEKFSYTRATLQTAILKEMERGNWMGVCCEPNLVFIVCNQFPLIAMRYNDVTNGTKVIEEVLPKYQAAWAKKSGFVGANGLFRRWYTPAQDKVQDAEDISHTVWAMAFMPWNYKLVQSMYPAAGKGYLHRIDDRMNLNPQVIGNKIRSLMKTDGADPDSAETLARARNLVAGNPLSLKKYMSPTFGYSAQWLSEIEGGSDLEALLRHADSFLKPTWAEGGLYYPRCDDGWDKDGNFTFVDPYSGNAGIGYARLNVKNGQKKMWDSPWTKKEVEGRPWVDGFGFESGVDCLRGMWEEKEHAMVVSLRTWDGKARLVELIVRALPIGEYGVYKNGNLLRVAKVDSSEMSVVVELEVDRSDTDLVVVRV